jgi:hypothetical protein
MGEEISLLLAQLIVLVARTPTIGDTAAFCDATASQNPLKLNDDQCRVVATILHYLYTVHFSFLFLEALNNYCVSTYVVNGVPLYGRFKNVLLGLGVPLVPVFATAVTHFNTYISSSSCWCNMEEVNFIGEIVPVLMLCASALIINEAAGMGNYIEHPDSIEKERQSAYASSRGAICVIIFSFAAWIIGMTAVNDTDLSLYSICSILNLILGIVIIIAHTLGNSRARNILAKLLCCCNCEKANSNAVENTPVEYFDHNDMGKNNDWENATGYNYDWANATGNNEECANATGQNEDEIDLDKMIRDISLAFVWK